MNVREIAKKAANLSPNYCEINREERNYAAILFAALCKPENARRFLEHCGFEPKLGPDFGIYLEYSYLRDLWNEIDSNEIKKEIIRRNLRIKRIDEILKWRPIEINKEFGVSGDGSPEFVQNPRNWSISKFQKNFKNDSNEDFLKICRFKWAFNIKPDIVIHLDKNNAICIEAKYESYEGSYPSSPADKEIFEERGIDLKNKELKKTLKLKQTDLQEYMMTELLGLETKFMFLVRKGKENEKPGKPRVVHWKTAFGWLDLGDLPCFAIEMIRRISEEKK
jgi:hypothetical protein